MNYRFGDAGRAKESRAQLIRSLFVGGTTIAEHTEKCIRKKVWTESELLGRANRACRDEVREALGEIINGLPFAGPTTKKKDGKPKWQQMELWEQTDFYYNCDLILARVGGDLTVHNNLARQCWQVFGDGPKQVGLAFVDEAAG
jgi:hypothetical protein